MSTILISGDSSGFGALTARALAAAGHTVYAGMRDVAGRNAGPAKAAEAEGLHPVELDVTEETSVQQAVRTVLDEQSTLDVLVHNAGHMVTGPAEAFTPEQLAALYGGRPGTHGVPAPRRPGRPAASGAVTAR